MNSRRKERESASVEEVLTGNFLFQRYGFVNVLVSPYQDDRRQRLQSR